MVFNGNQNTKSKNPEILKKVENSPEIIEGPEQNAQTERADLSLDMKEQEITEGKASSAIEQIRKGEKPKEFEWMPTTIKVGLCLGGAYLGYKFLKSLFGDEKKEGNSKAPMLLTGAAMAVGMGYLLTKDGLPDFLSKDWNLDLARDKAEEFYAKIKEGKVKEAIGGLNLSTKDKYIEEMAAKIEIDTKFLLDLRDVKYSEFLKHKDKKYSGTISYATFKTMELLGMDMDQNIPYTKADNEIREVRKDTRLFKYINNHKNKFTNIEDLTIGEILKELNKNNIPEINPKDVPEPKFSQDLEAVKNADGPSTYELIKGFATNDTEDPEKIKKLVNTAIDEGFTYFSWEGASYLFKNGTIFLLSPIVFFTDTVIDIFKAGFNEDYTAGDVAQSWYERGGFGYIGAGMGIGLAYASLQRVGLFEGKGDFFSEAVKGGFRGFIAPLNITSAVSVGGKTVYSALETANIYRNYLNFSADQLKDPNNKKLYEQARAIWAAEKYLQVFEETNAAHGGASILTKEGAMARGKELVLPGKSVAKRNLYATLFYRSRKAFLKLSNIVEDEPFRFNFLDLDDDADDMAREADKFLRNYKTIDAEQAVQDIIENVETTKNLEKIESLKTEKIETDTFFEAKIEERKAMVKAGASAEDLKKFDDELVAEFNRKRNSMVATIDALNNSDLSNAEKKALENVIKNDLSQGKGVRALFKEIKTRAKGGTVGYALQLVFGVAHMAVNVYESNETDQEKLVVDELSKMAKEVGIGTLQMTLDIITPFGLSYWYTVFNGHEFLRSEEEKVGTFWRVSSFAFGTLNLIKDSFALMGAGVTAGAGGVAIAGAGDAAELLVRAGMKAPEAVKAATTVVPQLTLLAKDVGGFKNLLKIINKNSTRIGDGIGKAELAAATGTLAYAGYEIAFNTEGQKEQIVELVEQPEALEIENNVGEA